MNMFDYKASWEMHMCLSS